MKNKVSFLIFLALPLLSVAQSEVKNAEDFKTGAVLKLQDCDTTDVHPGNSGAKQTWDFSKLKLKQDTITEWMVAPESTPYKDKFTGANQVEKYSNGSYVYVDKQNGQSYLMGYASPYMMVSYPKPVLFAKRPLSYKSKFSDSFTNKFSLSGMDFSGGGTATIEADGYGTLILPNKIYKHVLRVKITQIQTDTIKQYGSATTMRIVTYAWFDGEHASALLKISATKSQGFTTEEVEYLLSEEDK